ncbi:hypothetical protein Ahp1_08 [Aeromonas phage Ahp1]|uniref:Uncharacterized protein n=1 Tax=Aeromonas phage Ahp1 TaxID=1747286 RepID=A0A1S5Q8A4_9CAUD|nr:hypothetical protein HOS19_gp08 [Aeromonas phage Ahp1]ALP47727.1 hypothetical protein Ahp1_08 [Aeromonas phage Ahp1]
MNLQQWNAQQARLRHEEKRIAGATPEYHAAIQARVDRALAELAASHESQRMRHTTGGDFCHLARSLNTVSFRRGPK